MRVVLLGVIGLLAVGCASGGTSAPTGSSAANAPAAKRHRTHAPLDLAINGDGYFIVKAPAGGYLFTRLGALAVGKSGELVNEDGYELYPPVLVNDPKADVKIAADGAVRVEADGTSRLVGQIALARFEKPESVQREGAYLMPLNDDSVPITGKPGTKGLGTLVVGEVEE